MGSAAEDGGSSSRPQLIRPVHVADLLSREGHPLAARVEAARESRVREKDEPREYDGGALARRTLGVAAGAMLVLGSVAGGVLGLDGDGSNPAPSASSGEPVGTLPGKPSPGQPGIAPAIDGSTAPQLTNTAATESLPGSDTLRPAGEIGAPAAVKPPPVNAQRTEQPNLPAPRQPAPQQPAPAPAPPAGPVQKVTEPVTNTVEQTPAVGETLSDVVTPVTGTVDDTLQPALSLIGGLLSR